jgi:hypothetical protein
MHTVITKTKKRPIFHPFNYFVRNTELHLHSAVIILTVYLHKLTSVLTPHMSPFDTANSTADAVVSPSSSTHTHTHTLAVALPLFLLQLENL